MVLDQFIYFSMHQYVGIVILTREKRTENQTGGVIMVTIQILRAMSVPILIAVLLSTPAWADLGTRSGLPPINSNQPMVAQEGQTPHAESRTTHHDGLSQDSRKAGDPNLKSPGEGRDGSRTIGNPHATFNSIRPDERHEHDVRGSGIPLWRW